MIPDQYIKIRIDEERELESRFVGVTYAKICFIIAPPFPRK